MNVVAIGLIAAVLAQGTLALGLIWFLGFVRIPMIMRGEVRIRDIALAREGWPEREKKVSNAFDNQFQLPVLFYAAAGVSLLLGASWLSLLLAWAFVVSRYVHAAIHMTDNNVIRRFWTYTVGLGILTFYWLALIVQVVALALGLR